MEMSTHGKKWLGKGKVGLHLLTIGILASLKGWRTHTRKYLPPLSGRRGDAYRMTNYTEHFADLIATLVFVTEH